jgi:hypothetical protein
VPSSLRSNILIVVVLSDLIGRLVIIPRAFGPDHERMLVASDRMARIDVKQSKQL